MIRPPSRSRLAVAMIVRDEERCVARAIDSAIAHVDEVVVVDTGSIDATVAIAEQHGARVEHVEWKDDFAEARNAAIKAADADFILILDADEWVSSAGKLRDWVAWNARQSVAGVARITSSTESDGFPLQTTIEQIRLLPRGSRYVGAVHESPEGYRTEAPIPGLVLRHDGYEAAQIARKRGRNLPLLLRSLALDPGSPYLHFQIGREHQLLEDWAAAATEYEVARSHVTGRPRWQPELVARSLYTLSRLDRLDEGIKVARAELDAGSEAAEALFAIGNLFLDVAIARPAQHQRWVSLARSCWEACLRLGEDRARYDTTEGVGGYLAARNLAGLCRAAGDEEGCRRWTELEGVLRAAGNSA